MIELLKDEMCWQEFLQRKLDNPFLTEKEKKEFSDFIVNKRYKLICDRIALNSYSFSIPKRSEISKKYTDKKRVVYSFSYDEMMVLKFISNLLYSFDHLFAYNLYSFRKNKGAKNAIENFIHIKNIKNMYGYKVDISNYFNSIDKDILINDLKDNLKSDILPIFIDILDNDEAMFQGNLIHEMKGAMAGIPISSFLANYYIRDLDWYFTKKSVVYLRYSDDVILFANTKEELDEYAKYIRDYLISRKLSINPSKECYINPGDEFEFLGFSFHNNSIDISLNAIKKIKASIHHKAKMLLKWGNKKNVESFKLIKVMNKKYNTKFFGKTGEDLSWMYWYFPYITSVNRLKIVDKYLQNTERYMFSGKHNKANYRVCSYKMLKDLGYKSLVHEYYKFKKEMKQD